MTIGKFVLVWVPIVDHQKVSVFHYRHLCAGHVIFWEGVGGVAMFCAYVSYSSGQSIQYDLYCNFFLK